MVLYPIPPAGGRRRAGSRPDWRISAVSDPIPAGPGPGAQVCDLSPRYRIPGRAGSGPGSGQRAAGRAGQDVGQDVGQRIAGRQKAGIKKPRGVTPGASCAALGRIRSDRR